MASYRISLRPAAERDLRKIDPTIRLRIWNKIQSLAERPLPRGAEKLTGFLDTRLLESVVNTHREFVMEDDLG